MTTMFLIKRHRKILLTGDDSHDTWIEGQTLFRSNRWYFSGHNTNQTAIGQLGTIYENFSDPCCIQHELILIERLSLIEWNPGESFHK